MQKARWGELVDDDVDDEDDDSDSETADDSDESGDDAGLVSGISTPADFVSGISSVTSGLETPDAIDLRKGRESVSSLGNETPQQALYQVIMHNMAVVATYYSFMWSF